MTPLLEGCKLGVSPLSRKINYLGMCFVRRLLFVKVLFSMLTSIWRKGKFAACLELREHPQDKNMCMMICTEEYFIRSTFSSKKGLNQLCHL